MWKFATSSVELDCFEYINIIFPVKASTSLEIEKTKLLTQDEKVEVVEALDN